MPASRARRPSRTTQTTPSSREDGDAIEVHLLAEVARGDHDRPLAELYARYGTPLYRLGLRLLGDRGPAEELVQETFVRLWQSAGRFDPAQATVRTFVFLIARRVAVDLRRRAAVRPSLADTEPAVEPAAEPEGAVDRALLGLEVREALESLSGAHREVLELAYDADLTQTQIAARLDLPLGTVKTRTFHALRALRGELDRRGLHA